MQFFAVLTRLFNQQIYISNAERAADRNKNTTDSLIGDRDKEKKKKRIAGI